MRKQAEAYLLPRREKSRVHCWELWQAPLPGQVAALLVSGCREAVKW